MSKTYIRFNCPNCEKTVEQKYRPEHTFVTCPECENQQLMPKEPVLAFYELRLAHVCSGGICKKCKKHRLEENKTVMYSDCCGGIDWKVNTWCPECGPDYYVIWS